MTVPSQATDPVRAGGYLGRHEHILLVPEGVVRLNPTAAEVLELCDGERSLDEIVVALSDRYDGADLDNDVRGLVDALSQKGLVVDDA